MTHLIVTGRRMAYRAAHKLRSLYWRVRRPTTVGVRIAARSEDDELVVVRHSYGPSSLYLPGGRIDRGETCAEAAVREFEEETAIRPVRGEASLRLFGVYTSRRNGLTTHIILFELPPGEWDPAELGRAHHAAEITEVAMVAISDPPADLSRATRRRFVELATGHQAGFVW
jgi:8-oxo-dGTP pyrophosphatase MutT (NUDIX family)